MCHKSSGVWPDRPQYANQHSDNPTPNHTPTTTPRRRPQSPNTNRPKTNRPGKTAKFKNVVTDITAPAPTNHTGRMCSVGFSGNPASNSATLDAISAGYRLFHTGIKSATVGNSGVQLATHAAESAEEVKRRAAKNTGIAISAAHSGISKPTIPALSSSPRV